MLIRDLVDAYLSWCSRHRSPATVRFDRARLRLFCENFSNGDAASLTSLEIDAFPVTFLAFAATYGYERSPFEQLQQAFYEPHGDRVARPP